MLDLRGKPAKVFGWNVKYMFNNAISLSMPSVVDGGDFAVGNCRAETQADMQFQNDAGIFEITVLSSPN